MEEAYLQIAGIVRESIVDGPGIRFTVFCQGCPHHCPGCHNPQTHPFDGGQQAGVSRLVEEIRKNPLLQGVTFSGGEPFCQAGAFAALADEVHAAREGRLLLLRLDAGRTLAESGNRTGCGRAASEDRLSRRRAVCAQQAGFDPAVPRQPQPAGIRHEKEPGGRQSRAGGDMTTGAGIIVPAPVRLSKNKFSKNARIGSGVKVAKKRAKIRSLGSSPF